MSDYKQTVIIRSELEMSEGKTISQACHASLKSYNKADEELRQEWQSDGGKKVVLESGEERLEDLFNQAKTNNISAHLVKDAGHTEVEPGTVTALGIGPDEEQKIDKITEHLKLIK